MTTVSPRVIHCSSRYATIVYDGTKAKCSFELNRVLSIPEEYELYVSILSAAIPYTYYSIPQTTFTYTVGGTNQSLTLSAGNWSGFDIAAKLTNSHFALLFTPQTGLFTFTNKTANTIVINPSSILGLNTAYTLTANQSRNSQIIPDIAGTRYINIVSNLATDTIAAGNTPATSGCILSIPVAELPGELICYSPNNLVRHKLRENHISTLEITICDSNFQQLNLNGCDWELDILIEVNIPAKGIQYNESPGGLDLFAATRNYRVRK